MAETGIKGGIGFQLPVLATHPAAAPVGTIVLYRLNDGKLYAINDAGVSSEVGGGVADHGALSGLGDNDHPQYSLTTHDHASLYAALSHNHDGVYAEVDHDHDDQYYTETETDALLTGKADAVHTHDDQYYTETETDALLTGKADAADTRFPTADEKAALAGTGTPSGTNTYVTNDDTRLSDARTPTAHTHNATDINAGTLDDARLSSNIPQKNAASNTFQPSADSTTVFAVMNSAGTVTLIQVDATNGKIVIDGDIEVTGRISCAGIDNTTAP